MNYQATIGHNNPPSETEVLQQRLAENYTKEAGEYERLAGRDIPDTIDTDEQAGKITEYIKAVNNLKRTFTDAHKKEKAVYLECGRIVDNWKKGYEEKCQKLVSAASVPLQAFLDKKAAEERQRQLEIARKAREEADRLAAEAAAHEAEGINDTANDLMNAAVEADSKADMIQGSALQARAKARSETGFSASQRKVWVGEVESLAAIDLEKLRPFLSEQAIQTAINAFVRDGGRELRGVNIYQKTTVQVR